MSTVKEEWVPVRNTWGRDDDIWSMDHGWMIGGDPMDLILKVPPSSEGARGWLSKRTYEAIRKHMFDDPMYMKAYVTLLKSKEANPDHKFSYE